jgi:hypothetical protein
MQFNGLIVQNGRAIGEWEVALRGPVITGTDHWLCTVRVHGDVTSTVIEHTYADGIAMLIGKCLMTHSENEARKLRLKEPDRIRKP